MAKLEYAAVESKEYDFCAANILDTQSELIQYRSRLCRDDDMVDILY